jgi:hypothetical protein
MPGLARASSALNQPEKEGDTDADRGGDADTDLGGRCAARRPRAARHAGDVPRGISTHRQGLSSA